MRTFSLLLFLVLLPNHYSYSDDRSDPKWTASQIFTKGATLRHSELKDFYCASSKKHLDIGIQFSEQTLERYKKQGVDYYNQEFHNFDNLEFIVVRSNNKFSVVMVVGKAIMGIRNTSFRREKDVEDYLLLLKENGCFCYSRNLSLGELDRL